jgi:hypothetical protein
MRSLLGVPLCLLLATPVASAQNLTALRDEIAALAKATTPTARDTALVNLRDNAIKATLLDTAGLTEEGLKTVQEILATRRADVQAGASSGASGSTTAVASPLLPAIFGVAIEDGAITRTISGTTITIKVNPAGLFCAANPAVAAGVARRDDESCRTLWNRIGLTASFDTTRGEKKTELASLKTLDNQFSELTVRAEILNHRKATGARFQRFFRDELDAERARAQAFVDKNAVTMTDLVRLGILDDIEARLKALTGAGTWSAMSESGRVTAIEAEVKSALSKVPMDPAAFGEQRRLWVETLRSNRRLQNAIANAAVLTAEYAYRRADVAAEAIGSIVPKGGRPPSLHAFTVVFARGWGDKQLDVTTNAGLTLFDEKRQGMSGTFRDARLAAESKFKLRDLAGYGAPTLSFAGLYQFLNQEPLGLGITAFTGASIKERGHIRLLQIKLEFPTANNAVRIPLSFTASNRSELIKESDVRGQFGVSFNLDALFAEKKP